MKQTQRWIAFLLTLAMTFTLLPAAAFAADGADTSAEPAVVEEAAEEPVSAPETEEPAEPEETPQVSAAPAPQAKPQPQSDDNLVPYEKVINDMDEVNESIVMERDGHLVALVQFNDNIIDWDQEGEDEFFEKMEARKQAVLNFVNKHVSKSSKVNSVEVMKEPFEKTATHKIRRFKYKKDNSTSAETTIPSEDTSSTDGNKSE